jgi:ABC-type transport system substrate-binding protein
MNLIFIRLAIAIRKSGIVTSGLLGFSFAPFCYANDGSAFSVHGWDLSDIAENTPAVDLGNDPVVGKLACPPLTRLNLEKKLSEPVLLESITSTKASNNQLTWTLKYPNEMKWWSGEKVTGAELAEFLQTQLPIIVNHKGIGKWHLPHFEVKPNAEQIVVTWQSPPEFGPYVLNGVPFWKSTKNKAFATKYECAGSYRITGSLKNPELVANSKRTKPSKITLKGNSKGAPSGKDWIDFKFASDLGPSKYESKTLFDGKCTAELDLPIISVVSWNTASGITANPQFRRLMTQATPRGELLRSGATSLGDLLSGPVLRQHPAYNRNLLVREFNLASAELGLNKLGYSRVEAMGPRVDTARKPIVLRILTPDGKNTDMIEKVLSDSLAAVGIRTEFTAGKLSQAKNFDGVIVGLKMPWPELDFLKDFHSETKNRPEYWMFQDPELDRELIAYALSLTQKSPAFNQLGAIHKRFYNNEPMTILAQHSTCIALGSGVSKPHKEIAIRDPDWFANLF